MLATVKPCQPGASLWDRQPCSSQLWQGGWAGKLRVESVEASTACVADGVYECKREKDLGPRRFQKLSLRVLEAGTSSSLAVGLGGQPIISAMRKHVQIANPSTRQFEGIAQATTRHRSSRHLRACGSREQLSQQRSRYRALALVVQCSRRTTFGRRSVCCSSPICYFAPPTHSSASPAEAFHCFELCLSSVVREAVPGSSSVEAGAEALRIRSAAACLHRAMLAGLAPQERHAAEAMAAARRRGANRAAVFCGCSGDWFQKWKSQAAARCYGKG